jgi:hypothetical protein
VDVAGKRTFEFSTCEMANTDWEFASVFLGAVDPETVIDVGFSVAAKNDGDCVNDSYLYLDDISLQAFFDPAGGAP